MTSFFSTSIFLHACFSHFGRIDPFEGLGVLLFQFWMWKGITGDHGVALSCVIDEDGQDYGGLLQVLFRKTFVGVEVGMNAAGFVISGVLDELESRKADLVKGDVIGGTAVA